jgi:hypothetical protein
MELSESALLRDHRSLSFSKTAEDCRRFIGVLLIENDASAITLLKNWLQRFTGNGSSASASPVMRRL